ncbi:MAG: Holliday junction resolvase RuvX [Candidatus Aminicenantaceae bacterium]|jgi:putative Holliday junction resolvase
MDMRVLGLDYGDKNIGLAVSDPLLITAQGLGFYQQKGREKDLTYFQGLVAEYGIGRIVVGLPLRMDGTPGSRVEKTRRFADWLGSALGIPIVFWDERLTTKEAFRILREQKATPKKKKALKDQISATLILASYLENER